MNPGWKKTILLFCLILIAVFAYILIKSNTNPAMLWPFSPAVAYGDLPIKGVNLGNALEAPQPGEWGVNPQQEYFQEIYKAGFTAVRIPVRFSAHTSSGSPFSINPDFMDQVNKSVDAGLANHLIVILDVHHFDGMMEDPDRYGNELTAIWEQLSRMYQTYPDDLYFEILNEPSRNLTPEKWNILAARIITIIRKTNPVRKILVDGSPYASVDGLTSLVLPEDNNLIATFHFYEPFEFSHQGAEWVMDSDKWLGEQWKGTEEEKKEITKKLDEAARWSAQGNIPVILGEFGTITRADKASRVRWTRFVAREAERRNIGWIYWQLCSNFAVYSCEQNVWEQDLLGALIPIKTSK